MLLTSSKLSTNNNNVPFDENEVLRLMGNKQYAEAYILLCSKSELDVCDKYNLSLCLYHTACYDECLTHIEDIPLGDLRKLVMHQNMVIDAIRRKMFNFQAQHFRCFDSAISSKYLNQYPNLVIDNLLRLKVSTLETLERWSEIVKSVNNDMASKYKDLEEALIKARKNITE